MMRFLNDSDPNEEALFVERDTLHAVCKHHPTFYNKHFRGCVRRDILAGDRFSILRSKTTGHLVFVTGSDFMAFAEDVPALIVRLKACRNLFVKVQYFAAIGVHNQAYVETIRSRLMAFAMALTFDKTNEDFAETN